MTDAPDPSAPPQSFADTLADLVDPFTSYMGLKITELTGDRVTAVWEAKPHLHQPFGIMHGGAYCAVTEAMASMGAAAWLGDKGRIVGVNNNSDFFRAISEGALTSVATPLHRGRSQQLWVVETTSDADGRVVARGQVRLQNLY